MQPMLDRELVPHCGAAQDAIDDNVRRTAVGLILANPPPHLQKSQRIPICGLYAERHGSDSQGEAPLRYP
jgi:hypothetical protein